MSSHNKSNDIQEIRKAGFSLFMHKPISTNSIKKLIEQLPKKGAAA